jgi:hypothetical protein
MVEGYLAKMKTCPPTDSHTMLILLKTYRFQALPVPNSH